MYSRESSFPTTSSALRHWFIRQDRHAPNCSRRRFIRNGFWFVLIEIGDNIYMINQFFYLSPLPQIYTTELLSLSEYPCTAKLLAITIPRSLSSIRNIWLLKSLGSAGVISKWWCAGTCFLFLCFTVLCIYFTGMAVNLALDEIWNDINCMFCVLVISRTTCNSLCSPSSSPYSFEYFLTFKFLPISFYICGLPTCELGIWRGTSRYYVPG